MLPNAYKLGTANFYGYDFIVNPSTLIPRPETEQLVERTVVLVKKHLSESPRILDLGTGSGAIAITLKKLLPAAAVEASDLSPQALRVASQNTEQNQVKVTFHHGSLFTPITGVFDLVIANLPYVPSHRWPLIEAQVRLHEPISAIVAGVDGLDLIKGFCRGVGAHLKSSSIVALEIDDTHGPRVLKLLQTALPSHRCWIEKDLAGFDRFAFAEPRT